MQCNSTQTPTVVNGQQREQFYSLYKTNAMYSFWSGQWCCCSLSLPAEVVLHSALPQNSTFFLPSNHKSSLRNRRLILDSCMQFKTFLAIISCFNPALFFFHTYRRSSCIPGLQWDRMRSEHLGRSKQCGLRVCPPLLHSCKYVNKYSFICSKRNWSTIIAIFMISDVYHGNWMIAMYCIWLF